MTTRNFRVHNGISVGDIVISASANTITGLATGAPSADGDVANKKYVDDQDANIASDTLTFTNKTLDANGTGNSITNIEVADFAGTAIINVAETLASNDSDTALVTAGAIIDYVDAQDANIAGDTLTFTNKTFDANGTGNSISNIEVADFASGVVDTDISAVSASDDTLASAKAIKAYVDGEISTAENADTTITVGNSSVVVADSGTGTITVTADGVSVASFAEAATTITATGAINLTAGSDVVIPANVGITFGDDGEKIEGNGTNLTISSSGELTMTATGTTTVTNNFDVGGNMVISGDLVVQGTETIISTQNLLIEDAIIGLNSNVSDPNDMPRFSGIHLHRGNTSVATEVDLYMVWDDAVNASGSTTNLGGVFTFMGSVHESESEAPNSGSFILADIKASTVEANLTGNASTATEATNVTVTANNATNETVYIAFVDGATGTQGIETDTGLSYNPSTNVLSTTASAAQYADVAERFEADAPMEIGTVVEVGGTAEITEATSEMSQDVFGVISDKPAYMMNAGAGDNTTHPFVAMTGRTPVRVVGAVTKGQRLVTSSTKGCARAAQPGESISPFNVIGRALETNTEAGIKLVNCAVRTNN
jgi:hypothetical protein